MKPSSVIFWRTALSAKASLKAAFNRATISAGVPAGTEMPNGMVHSVPGSPASPTVGTSGSSSTRSLVATASPRTLPARIEVAVGTRTSENSGTWPAITSFNASALPL